MGIFQSTPNNADADAHPDSPAPPTSDSTSDSTSASASASASATEPQLGIAESVLRTMTKYLDVHSALAHVPPDPATTAIYDAVPQPSPQSQPRSAEQAPPPTPTSSDPIDVYMSRVAPDPLVRVLSSSSSAPKPAAADAPHAPDDNV